MATATNRGWGTPPAPRTVLVPCAGIPLRVRPEVAPLFAELIRRVEAIKGAGWMTSSGGYNLRPVRGYELKYSATKNDSYLSNHSWGLAGDFRAGTNPMNTRLISDMPQGIAQIAADCGLEWGGSWSGRKDPMHFEFVGTPAQAAAAVARLTAHQEDDLTPEQDRRLANVEGILARALDTQRPSRVKGSSWKGFATDFVESTDANVYSLGQRVSAIEATVNAIAKKLGV